MNRACQVQSDGMWQITPVLIAQSESVLSSIADADNLEVSVSLDKKLSPPALSSP